MVLEFTLFNDDALLEGGAHVYVGHVKDEGEVPIAYRIKFKGAKFWLFDGKPKNNGRRELLNGKLSFFKSYGTIGTIHGYNSTFDIVRSGMFSTKLKFIDTFTGRKYKWKVDGLGISWELKDPEGNSVAYFERHVMKMTRHGRLTVLQDNVPEHLLGLILLTHKLLHNLVKLAERQNSRNNRNNIARANAF